MSDGTIFNDALHDQFGTWPLAYIPYGGADFGEIRALARAVGDGDDAAFFEAWMAAGNRFTEQAEDALRRGRQASARQSYLRASCFYGASYHPLYGEPVDPRLVSAFRKQIGAFDKGMALSNPPVKPLRIPFEGTTLPAYLIPAVGRADEMRPLVIQTNGYDATVTDLYFASAVAASERGYHCLIFDGPGQGEMLIEHGMRLRADWETVINAVVDFALMLPNVDAARIALSGWSLGGYLAPRAASGEPRIAACIADPGLLGLSQGARDFIAKLGGTPQAAVRPGDADKEFLDRALQTIMNDRKLRWGIVQRGFWVLGANDLVGFLRATEPFTLEGRIEQIRCPTLLTCAEDDPLAAGAQALFDALRCPRKLIRFGSAEGAGDHCEMMNRSLLNRRALDWLDDLFGGAKSA